MLQEISIKNFAIIEEIHLSFESGMTILTGETGAGKSIIIDAMGLLLGGRSSSDFVRTGKDKAEIEGLFFAGKNAELDQKLENLGLERSTELILRRDIFANGRSVCRVNGQMVNLTTLREIGARQPLLPRQRIARRQPFGRRRRGHPRRGNTSQGILDLAQQRQTTVH